MARSHPSAITSRYSTYAASEPTTLWQGPLHLLAGGARGTGRGSIELQWRPGPWIGWAQEMPSIIPPILSADSGRLRAWGIGASANYRRTSTRYDSGVVRSTGYLPGGIERGARLPLYSLDFHLVNFPDYVGDLVTGEGATWRGRASFLGAGWLTQLDWRPSYGQLKEELRIDRGYALTHVGRVSRTSGAAFTPGRAIRHIDALWHFFGFVRGAWSGPALLIGRDRSGNVVWEQWSIRRVSSAEHRPSLFDHRDPDVLTRLSPGFLSRAGSEAWGEPFNRAVKLYVDGNVSIPIEVGIILAQAGLELLAWSTFVRSGRVAPGAFKDWSAARQFRELLTRARVPMTVPGRLLALGDSLPTLGTAADAADRVAYVRNRIVHPPRNRRAGSLPSELIIDAWRLSLHYLELAILHRARYSGSIWSRVEDAVVPVPW
jgi:hypothetical protein